MANKITVLEAAQEAGYDTPEDCLQEVILGDANCPALCSDGCEVEVDGRCPHGFPSLALAMGIV